ncbi:MAG: type II secretion system F family protein [Aurantimonas endophytica]|uniref:Tight adherence protein B n=1 Tax=Aurantimonas endophytica TaxID=1522175 RepID=A0A7W6HCY4_9HYPH|nr:type II secretion system F family protein [Aurantimonas endophytica]MBB4002683.1 tight adherence protein B [Aurantimonas endophytica]MCO6403563.1 pilus assembly protein [Aurantimonas endophytica]
MLTSAAGILFILLSTIAAGGLAYAVLQPRITAEKKVEARRSQYSRDENDRVAVKFARERLREQDKRRKTIQSSLKELEARTRERDKLTGKLSLARRLEQAGLTITPRHFAWISVGTGVTSAILALVFGAGLVLSLGIAVVGGLGLPRFALAHLRKKRLQKFTDEFPNALDLIVRGIRSGLPLNDTLRMIAGEAAEPVRSEFRKIVETQQMGVSTSESVERLYRNVPTAETNFFSIVITIQAQAGGNLSEAIANLSKVLRERKKMKGKIQAMSMEAKASATIIGALPVIVGFLVYLTTPDYIGILFATHSGNLLMIVAAVWMAIGVFTMKRMISFDF